MVAARYRSLLLVPTFSMSDIKFLVSLQNLRLEQSSKEAWFPQAITNLHEDRVPSNICVI